MQLHSFSIKLGFYDVRFVVKHLVNLQEGEHQAFLIFICMDMHLKGWEVGDYL